MESVFLEIEGRPVPFFISDLEYSGADILKLRFEGYDSDKKTSEFIGCSVFLTSDKIKGRQKKNVQDITGFMVLTEEDGATLELRREREISRWRLHLVKHRSTLKNRVHSTLITFGHQRHMSDLFGVAGRRLLGELEIPEPWRSHVDASLVLIDDLEGRITQIAKELRRSGADHRYIPILMSAPGFGWITSFTVACEIADITRFSSPVKLTGYTGLCPRVKQSGQMDQRGPLSKHGPKYLRWGLMEAAIAASSHPLYRERYQRTRRRLGKQRGPKVAQIDLARQLTEAIWYMLTRNQPFAPAGAIYRLVALSDSPFWNCATGASPDDT